MNDVLVITGVRGESWRCQAVTQRGRRCTDPAVLEAVHPVHRTLMRVCARHAKRIAAGAEIRFNAAAGVDQMRVATEGGPFDGDPIDVPADLRVGQEWVVQLVGGSHHVYRLTEGGRLQHVGVTEPPFPAPGAPEQTDTPRQP